MPINIGREMALPLEQIIGGPLQAVVQGQVLAANATADFIQQVGLLGDSSDQQRVRTVDFKFRRTRPSVSGDNQDEIKTEEVTLNVPLLTILPVPFIRIEEAEIDFEAKVSSITTNQTSTAFGVAVGASVFGGKLRINVNYSQSAKFSDQVNRAATLGVKVRAVQDETPAGLAKVLEILETAITDSEATEVSN